MADDRFVSRPAPAKSSPLPDGTSLGDFAPVPVDPELARPDPEPTPWTGSHHEAQAWLAKELGRERAMDGDLVASLATLLDARLPRLPRLESLEYAAPEDIPCPICRAMSIQPCVGLPKGFWHQDRSTQKLVPRQR